MGTGEAKILALKSPPTQIDWMRYASLPNSRSPRPTEQESIEDSARMSNYADVAQLVEQRIRNAKVGGSTPLIGTIKQMFLFVRLMTKSQIAFGR